MLKQIIIWTTKQQQQNRAIGYEWETECSKKGISCVFIDTNAQSYTQTDTHSDENSLLITDIDLDQAVEKQMISAEQRDKLSHVPIIGLGLDYTGSCTFILEDLDTADLHYFEMVYARYHHLPLTIAESERLVIREISLQDLDQLYELYQSLEGCPFIEPLYEREEEERFTRDYIKNMYGFYGYGLWLVFRKSDGKLIGRAGIENRELDGVQEQELGYLIGKPWQRQHYAEEVCHTIMQYASEYLGIETLYLCTEQKNIPSIALAQKLGFRLYAQDVDGMNVYIIDQMHNE